MKKLAVSIILALFVIVISAQNPCLPEGITFTTQEQIDSFQITYPNCTEIEGDVQISGDNIDNLLGLSVITSIDGDLLIGDTVPPANGNPLLIKLEGLENLTSIVGSLTIIGNTTLSSIVAVENLSYIGGNLGVNYNFNLTSLTGLDNVTFIGGDIWIGGNPLTSLTGLEGLTSIEGSFEIGALWQNTYLTSLTGLNNVTSIIGDFRITTCHVLTSLVGLESLTTIGGDLIIGTCQGQGLYGNPALESLTGLESLTSIGGDLHVRCNNSLTNCEAQGVCDYLASPNGTFSISNNAPGCNSPYEVIEACEFVGIEEQSIQPLTIHPNPSDKGSITITLDNLRNLQLSFFNTFGQQFHQHEVQSTKTTINISTWTPGIYLAVVYEKGKPLGRAKFVVQ